MHTPDYFLLNLALQSFRRDLKNSMKLWECFFNSVFIRCNLRKEDGKDVEDKVKDKQQAKSKENMIDISNTQHNQQILLYTQPFQTLNNNITKQHNTILPQDINNKTHNNSNKIIMKKPSIIRVNNSINHKLNQLQSQVTKLQSQSIVYQQTIVTLQHQVDYLQHERRGDKERISRLEEKINILQRSFSINNENHNNKETIKLLKEKIDALVYTISRNLKYEYQEARRYQKFYPGLSLQLLVDEDIRNYV